MKIGAYDYFQLYTNTYKKWKINGQKSFKVYRNNPDTIML